MIYGLDVHPKFQAGLNIEQVRAESFDFIAIKLSEATTTYPGLDWINRAKACGLLALGYHFLRPGNEDVQARVFTQQLQAGGVPGMLDAEALADDGKTPTLTVTGIRRFLSACTARGARIPLLYLPRWYWQRLGSPDLSGLPALWASSYVTGAGFAAELYESVTPTRWAAYGNLPVTVLQFTDKAHVAGKVIDADVFLGTRDQFAALIGGSDLTPDESQKLDTILHVLTDPIHSEVPGSDYSGPPRDFWMHTDRATYMSEQVINAQSATIIALTQAVATQHGLSVDDIKAVLDQELGKVVNVRVSIDAPPTGTP
jgi:hypothetical protein